MNNNQKFFQLATVIYHCSPSLSRETVIGFSVPFNEYEKLRKEIFFGDFFFWSHNKDNKSLRLK